MVCLGKRCVKTKDSRDMVIVSAAGIRVSDGSVYTDQIWLMPNQAADLQVGDQFRAFRDGGIMIIEGCAIDTAWLKDIL